MKKPNPHAGHRTRLRERFFREDLDHFEDHQVLELLLFYCIPRRDTNELAHRLLDRYKSIPGVLEASVSDLESVEGMGRSSALFLHLIHQVIRRYLRDAAAVKRNMVYLFTWDETREFVESLFMGCHSEVCYVLLLDSRHGLIDYRKMDGGTDRSIAVTPNWVASYMYEKHAAGVILAHNHPISRAVPSDLDAVFTERVAARLHALGGELYDHIIVGENETCSWVHDPKRFIRLKEGVFSDFYPSIRKDS